MTDYLGAWEVIRHLTWDDVFVLLAIVAIARLLTVLVRRAFRQLAESTAARFRLNILRGSSILRLAIGLGAVLLTIPILVEPTPQNVIALAAGTGVVVALAVKDYASSIVAGLTAVLENVYQPGDWIEIGGTYGEVKAITLRAVRLTTADETEVVIPHSRLWSSSVANATGGKQGLLCVARFYLHPDHDALRVRRALEGVAATSVYTAPNTSSSLVVTEQPWATEYKLKAHVNESREQFSFTTDLTVRGKAALQTLGVRFATAPYAVPGVGCILATFAGAA